MLTKQEKWGIYKGTLKRFENWFFSEYNYSIKETAQKHLVNIDELVFACKAPLISRKPNDLAYGIEPYYYEDNWMVEFVDEVFSKRLLTIFPEGFTIFLDCERSITREKCKWIIKNNALHSWKVREDDPWVLFDACVEYTYGPDWISLNLDKKNVLKAMKQFMGRIDAENTFLIPSRYRHIANCLLRHSRICGKEDLDFYYGYRDKSLILHFIDPVFLMAPHAEGLGMYICPDNPLYEKICALFPVTES